MERVAGIEPAFPFLLPFWRAAPLRFVPLPLFKPTSRAHEFAGFRCSPSGLGGNANEKFHAEMAIVHEYTHAGFDCRYQHQGLPREKVILRDLLNRKRVPNRHSKRVKKTLLPDHRPVLIDLGADLDRHPVCIPA